MLAHRSLWPFNFRLGLDGKIRFSPEYSSQSSRAFSHAALFRFKQRHHCICLTTFLIHTPLHILLCQTSHIHRHMYPFFRGSTRSSLHILLSGISTSLGDWSEWKHIKYSNVLNNLFDPFHWHSQIKSESQVSEIKFGFKICLSGWEKGKAPSLYW